jgi:hypothetical protein
LKPGGFWLVSFPLGGHHAKNYEKKVGDYTRIHSHLREFTPYSSDNYLNIPNITILEDKIERVGGYGGNIRSVLAQIK